jgi:hypothetical protein
MPPYDPPHRRPRDSRPPRDPRNAPRGPRAPSFDRSAPHAAHAPHDAASLHTLLIFLRDTFRDAASRIDHYLAHATSSEPMRERRERGPWDRNERFRSGPPRDEHEASRSDPGIRVPLESLRDEARSISQDAPDLDPAELRLRIEAVTAETRALQNRASDPEDRDIAAKILRVLTAIVSEHRPGHVYGLARHHHADWEEVARRARNDLAMGGSEAEDGDEDEGGMDDVDRAPDEEEAPE